MTISLLALLQGVGAVTLAVVAFAFALTWPALIASVQAVRSARARLLAFCGLGGLLLLAGVPLYLAPGVLLRDQFAFALAFPVVATWLIASGALVTRGLVSGGVVRGISFAFASASLSGLLVGVASAVLAEHGAPDTVTPTGAFLLGLAAVTAVVVWSKTDSVAVRPL